MTAQKSAAALAACGVVLFLSGCGGGASSAPTPAPKPTAAKLSNPALGDPCSLLTDEDVSAIAPDVHHQKLDTVAGTNKICEWPNERGIPVVLLQVTPADPAGPGAELKTSLGPAGYKIVDVKGIGDRAAAAVQEADPSKGLTAGVASLVVQAGGYDVDLSTPRVEIRPGSPKFAALRQMAGLAVDRLTH